ncbi:MAG: branched-chain amino acid ABC transporter permease [Zestosphaera sp.]
MLPSPGLLFQSVLDGIFLGFLYSLIALGLSLVFGVMGIINFAHGDFIMLGSYLVWILANSLRSDPSLMSIATVPLFFVMGAAIYTAIIRPVLGKEPLIQIAVTVGVGYVLQNLALMMFRAEPRAVQTTYLNFYLNLGLVSVHVAKLISALLSLFIVLGVHYLLTKTWVGLAIRATAYDREVASLMGINVGKVFLLVFSLGIALTGLAASLWMTFGQADPYIGSSFGLLTWVIIALGGLGGVSGLLASSVIVGVIQSLTMTLVSPTVSLAIPYVVFIIVLWFRPQGLFGKG